jgi:hypothetical protein
LINTENLIAYDEFLETRFYKEWMQPQGLVDLASTVLDKSPTAAAMFVVVRHERDGLVDDEMRREAAPRRTASASWSAGRPSDRSQDRRRFEIC